MQINCMAMVDRDILTPCKNRSPDVPLQGRCIADSAGLCRAFQTGGPQPPARDVQGAGRGRGEGGGRGLGWYLREGNSLQADPQDLQYTG